MRPAEKLCTFIHFLVAIMYCLIYVMFYFSSASYPVLRRPFLQQSLLGYLRGGPPSWIKDRGWERLATAMAEPKAPAFYDTLWRGLGDGLR